MKARRTQPDRRAERNGQPVADDSQSSRRGRGQAVDLSVPSVTASRRNKGLIWRVHANIGWVISMSPLSPKLMHACASLHMQRMLTISDAKQPTDSLGKPPRVWIGSLVAHILGVKLRSPRRSDPKFIHRERKRHVLLNAAVCAAAKT